ncbi:MAG: IPT/TIG domain-containing protein [Kofleriaceae bacterium]
MRRRPPPPNPTTTGPTEAPPTPREEHQAARSGFVWIPGKWDWKGKWEWTAGHWERERANKQWRGGHWDKSGASWSWTEGDWIDGGAAMPPPSNDHHPHQAPPPPRSETPSMKAGFSWIPGRWDWKNDQWAWVDGHWERERAGKKWRPAEWQNQSSTWVLVDGDWIDASAPMPPPGAGMQPPPPMPGNTGIVPPHHWRVERPTVSSYWPAKGKAGSRVVIRGRNFSQETRVMWGPDEVRAAKVRDDEIEFRVPDNATTATILLKGERGRDLIVGNFEVANYDAAAEARRIEAERQAAAQAAWTASQAKMAKDSAARQAALDHRWNELDSSREHRRGQRVQEIRAKWQAAFLGDPDTQDELTMHAERVAQLTRAKDVAGVTNNQKLGIRIDVALAKENDRHDQRMAALQTAFSTKGGH